MVRVKRPCLTKLGLAPPICEAQRELAWRRQKSAAKQWLRKVMRIDQNMNCCIGVLSL